jgi:hypothetical protein
MAQFYEGGAAMYDALVYARPHENTLQFLNHQAQNFYGALTEAGRQFTESARSFYDSIGLSYSAKQLRALGRMVTGIWQTDDVRPLYTLEEFQQAPPVMRRWIMAEPTIREMYHQQRVEGYNNLYVDMYPNDVGPEHYDFRQITSGVVKEKEDGSWVARTYYEEKHDRDSTPTMMEKIDIHTTWDRLRGLLKHPTNDPTSVFGDERG